MESNLDKRPSIGEIAENASLSEDYFRRLFTNQVGISPIQYLNHLRVREGRRLLSEDPSMSASQAAKSAGFVDVRHFARVFRKYYNMSPAEYRQSLTLLPNIIGLGG
jgi:transcriptional regulator GlxA family with amidase domain